MSALDEDEGTHELAREHSGWEQVPSALYLDTTISDGAVRLWIVLSDRGAKGDTGAPSRKKLAKLLGLKSPRSVDTRIKELQAKGWLLVTPRFRLDQPGMTSNLYTLLMKPIKGAGDPRLVKHREAVAAFEREMAARQTTKSQRAAAQSARSGASDPVQDSATPPSQDSAGPPLAESCEGPSQLAAPHPAQDSAHHKPDLSCPDLLGTRRSEDELRSSSGDAAAPPPSSDQLPGMPAPEPPKPPRRPKAKTPDPAVATDEDMASAAPLPTEKLGSAANQVVASYFDWFREQTGESRIPKARQCAITLANEYVRPALEAGYTPRETWQALAAASRNPRGQVVDVWPSQLTWRRALRGVTSESVAAARRQGGTNLHTGGLSPDQLRAMSEAAFA